MHPMGCRAATDGRARLHRCLARVVDYSVPEDGGLTSASVHSGRARGEGPGQCFLWIYTPSLRSELSKSRSCMKATDPSESPQSLTHMAQQPAYHRKAVIPGEIHSLSICAAGDCRAHDVTSGGDHEEHTWAFQLHLQDATASIVASVSAIDGDAFFTVVKVLRLAPPPPHRAIPWQCGHISAIFFWKCPYPLPLSEV